MIPGYQQTKQWRLDTFGRVSGGSGTTEIEKAQSSFLSDTLGVQLHKSEGLRINMETHRLGNNYRPFCSTTADGLLWTEDFDRTFEYGSSTVYVNLKSAVGTGGSQTRTLRECGHFILAQLNVLIHNPSERMFFVNALDGDEAHKRMPHFKYILDMPMYRDVRHRVYVGDTLGAVDWIRANVG